MVQVRLVLEHIFEHHSIGQEGLQHCHPQDTREDQDPEQLAALDSEARHISFYGYIPSTEKVLHEVTHALEHESFPENVLSVAADDTHPTAQALDDEHSHGDYNRNIKRCLVENVRFSTVTFGLCANVDIPHYLQETYAE